MKAKRASLSILLFIVWMVTLLGLPLSACTQAPAQTVTATPTLPTTTPPPTIEQQTLTHSQSLTAGSNMVTYTGPNQSAVDAFASIADKIVNNPSAKLPTDALWNIVDYRGEWGTDGSQIKTMITWMQVAITVSQNCIWRY